jgi:hypothetical protein
MKIPRPVWQLARVVARAAHFVGAGERRIEQRLATGELA